MPRARLRSLMIGSSLSLLASAASADLPLRPPPAPPAANGVFFPNVVIQQGLESPAAPGAGNPQRAGGSTQFGRLDFPPAIPEPSAWLLFGAGFAAVALRRRPRA